MIGYIKQKLEERKLKKSLIDFANELETADDIREKNGTEEIINNK